MLWTNLKTSWNLHINLVLTGRAGHILSNRVNTETQHKVGPWLQSCCKTTTKIPQDYSLLYQNIKRQSSRKVRIYFLQSVQKWERAKIGWDRGQRERWGYWGLCTESWRWVNFFRVKQTSSELWHCTGPCVTSAHVWTIVLTTARRAGIRQRRAERSHTVSSNTKLLNSHSVL